MHARPILIVSLVAFPMGMCFPLGLRLFREYADSCLPWMWGINGATGVGKTWIACALAHKACREGVILMDMTFMSDFLVENPHTGKLVTGPSISPENWFLTPAGDTAAINMGPAMDLQIVWHLFTSVIEASKVLDRDEEFRSLLESQLEQLAPVKIGHDGRILEWSDEALKEV